MLFKSHYTKRYVDVDNFSVPASPFSRTEGARQKEVLIKNGNVEKSSPRCLHNDSLTRVQENPRLRKTCEFTRWNLFSMQVE